MRLLKDYFENLQIKIKSYIQFYNLYFKNVYQTNLTFSLNLNYLKFLLVLFKELFLTDVLSAIMIDYSVK